MIINRNITICAYVIHDKDVVKVCGKIHLTPHTIRLLQENKSCTRVEENSFARLKVLTLVCCFTLTLTFLFHPPFPLISTHTHTKAQPAPSLPQKKTKHLNS